MLSIAFARNSDLGICYILFSCEIPLYVGDQSSPFGDKALLVNAPRMETMWFL
ncbi:hypothetical protein BC332_21320 [Capsicum chinense]|nr:hypothetical protein BC332_21320 [Capsicum chinense]